MSCFQPIQQNLEEIILHFFQDRFLVEHILVWALKFKV